MLKGIDVNELSRRVVNQQALKKDFIADSGRLNFQVLEGVPRLNIEGTSGLLNVLPLCHEHISGKTGIPAPYYNKMLKDAPSLLTDNVNHWFTRGTDKHMIRTLGTSARAVLSNRYQRIDDYEVANTALPILADLKVQIVSAEITERRMYIQFTLPTVQAEVKVGDVVQAGGIIANSEVGCGSVSVSGIIWRLMCLNGMKTADIFRKVHIGRHVDSSEELWEQDTQRADDRAILLKVRDMVKAVVDETRFRTNVDKLKGLAETKVTGHILAAVEVLEQKIGTSREETYNILQALANGGDLTAWGMVNAVTAQAHSCKSYDRAVEFEALGGKMIELPKSEWRQILEAE